jgi:hypothetical protein
MAEMSDVVGPMAFNPITNVWVATVPAPPGQPGTCANEPEGWNPCTQQWQEVMKLNGRTDGSVATAGQVGEVMQITQANVQVAVTGPPPAPQLWVSVASLTLSPGDWDWTGSINWDLSGLNSGTATTATNVPATVELSTNPATPNLGQGATLTVVPATTTVPASMIVMAALPTVTSNVTVPTPIYVLAQIASTVTTDAGKVTAATGYLHARRMT